MKKMKIIGLLLVMNTMAHTVWADSTFRSYQADRVDFDLTLNYFKTTANFSAGGSKADLYSGHSLQAIDTVMQGRYVLFNDLALFAGLNVSNVESNDAVATRTNSSVNKIYLGSDFQFLNTSFFNLSAEVSYLQNLEKIDVNGDSVLNSDGANEISASLASVIHLDWAYPFFKGGIKYRTEGLSTLLTYTAGLEMRFDDAAIGGVINGFSSIKDDEKTDQSYLRDEVIGRVNAGSKKYYSVNPNLIDSEIYLKYKFSHEFSMKGFAGYTLTGSNTAEGLHAGAEITWGFGGTDRPISRPTHRATPSRQTKKSHETNPGFVEDTNDGVNQDYFKPVSPSKDEYIEQLEGSPKSLRNATEPEPTTVTPAAKPTQPTLQDNGYQIKLKKIKKKKKP